MDNEENSVIVEGMLVRPDLDFSALFKGNGIVVKIEELQPSARNLVRSFKPRRTHIVDVLWPGRPRSEMHFNDELMPVENQNEE